MKRQKSLWAFLFAALLVTAMAACSTDDPSPDAYNFDESIAAGNWRINRVDGFYDMEYMNGIILDSSYVGGRLQLDQNPRHYALYNGKNELTSEGTWRAGRWYVCLTQNNSKEDTLGVSFGSDRFADFDPSSWRHSLNLYKSHQQATGNGGGNITDKQVTLYMSK